MTVARPEGKLADLGPADAAAGARRSEAHDDPRIAQRDQRIARQGQRRQAAHAAIVRRQPPGASQPQRTESTRVERYGLEAQLGHARPELMTVRGSADQPVAPGD